MRGSSSSFSLALRDPGTHNFPHSDPTLEGARGCSWCARAQWGCPSRMRDLGQHVALQVDSTLAA